jgi:RHS repeat-associated protein
VSNTYDASGNTTTKTDSTGTTTYSWDYDNRLTSVTLPGSGGAVSFKYDPFGRRIYKSSSSGTSVYAYDAKNLVEETNATGAVVSRYLQGFYMDEPLAMLRSATTSYYQVDGLGSVTSLTNSAGAAAQTYTYDSFGNIVATTGSLTNSFRYTGREFDTETSLYYYRARYYDSITGRFLREDPKRFQTTSTNFYLYVRNNPINGKDPYGLFTINLGGTLSGQFGPINLNYSGGVVIGSDGSFGVYNTGGAGAGIGAGGFFGLTGGISTAKSICGFGGPFVETGENAGLGPGEGVSVYTGLDADGVTPVGGGSVTVGIGGGADVYTDVTVTKITPIIRGTSSSCGCP